MVFKKLITKPKQKQQRIKITSFEKGLSFKKDENILPFFYASAEYNFNNNNGALKDGLGISPISGKLPFSSAFNTKLATELANIGEIKACYFSKKYNQTTLERQDKLVLLKNDNTLCYLPLYEGQNVPETILETIENLELNSKPVAVNYRLNGEDCTIFSSPNDAMFVLGLSGGVVTVADAPFISSMAIHYERLFATTDGEQSKIWFSDDLDPTNFSVGLDEAGFIEMLDERGALKKVISFNDYIYIFRDYGITRLSAYGEQTNFNVSQLFVSSGKIYPNSVCVCGDEIIFLASDGLYSFNGLNATKILDNISLGFTGQNNENAMAAYLENKYYLACNFDFKDGNIIGERNAINNCVIQIDLITKTALFLRGADVCHILAVKTDGFNGVLVCAKDYQSQNYSLGVLDCCGKIFGFATNKVWQTPQTDFGFTGQTKTILDFVVSTKTGLKITLLNENNEEKSFIIPGANKAQKICTKFSGEKISFRLESTSTNTLISCPNIRISVGRRGA